MDQLKNSITVIAALSSLFVLFSCHGASQGQTVLGKAGGPSIDSVDSSAHPEKFFHAHEALLKTNPERALPIFENALKRHPKDMHLLLGKARALFNLNRHAQAQAVYRQMLEIEPQSVTARIALADSLRISSKRAESMKLLKEAAAISPDDPSLHSTLSLWYTDGHMWKEGMGEINRCISLLGGKFDPGHYAHRGNIFRALGQPRAALTDYNTAIKGDASAQHYFLRAHAYSDLKQDDLAIADFRKTIALEPSHWQAHNLLGFMLTRHDKPAEAIELFNKTIKLNPRIVDPHIHKANTQKALKQYAKALETWRQIEKQFPLDKNCYYNRAHLFWDLGNHQAALKDLARAIELDPQEGEYFNARGTLYKNHLRSPEKALQDFESAGRCRVPKPAYFNAQAELLNSFGRYREADLAASQALKLNRNDTYAYHLRGVAQLKAGQYKEAAADFGRILAIKPDDAWTLDLKGEALMDLGSYREAVTALSRSISLNPRLSQKYNKRARCFSALKEWQKAVADYTMSLKLRPDRGILIERGKVYMAAGMNDRALSDFTRAIEIDPLYAVGYIERARLYDKIGKTEQARKDRKEADTRGFNELMSD